MKKSVLVDFYNLHSQIKRLKETPKPSPAYPPPNILEKLKGKRGVRGTAIIPINTDELNKDERELLRFFENYAPHIAKKFTQYFIGYTTIEVEGGEMRKISRSESDYFDHFAREHQHIKLLIDRYLDDGYFTLANLDWLESRMSRMNMSWINEILVQKARGDYKNLRIVEDDEFLNRCARASKRFLGELFPQIYNEVKSVLKGELEIDRCQRNGCNNIFLKSGNRKYCDTCKTPAKREVDKQTKRRKAEINHIQLSALIDKWLPEKGDMSITAYSLMRKLKGISELKREPRYLQSPRSLGRYLNLKEMQDMLEEKGIHIKVCKDRKGATYNFTRIQ